MVDEREAEVSAPSRLALIPPIQEDKSPKDDGRQDEALHDDFQPPNLLV
jgi:hypothetical protein